MSRPGPGRGDKETRRRGRRGRSVSQTLVLLWGIGLTVSFAVAALILGWSSFLDLLRRDPKLFFESILLAVTTFALFVMYAVATHSEIDLLKEYLDESSLDRPRHRVYYTIVLLGVFFGLLIALTRYIIPYLILMLLYDLTDLWGGRQVRVAVLRLIDQELRQRKPTESERKVLDHLHRFYAERPTFERIATVMFVNWIALTLAIVSALAANEWAWLRELAFAIAIINIIVAEAVIFRWRRQRDDGIEVLEHNMVR